MKICSLCKIEKPVEDFYKNRTKAGGIQNECKACELEAKKKYYIENKEAIALKKAAYYQEHSTNIKEKRAEHYKTHTEVAREYYKRNKEELNKHSRDMHRKRKFKLTPEEFELLKEKQNGVCAICGKPESVSGRELSVDHDRSCCPGNKSCGNCIRGLLCNKCNPMIGYAQDDTEILRKAILYIEIYDTAKSADTRLDVGAPPNIA